MRRVLKGKGLSPGRVRGKAALAVHMPVKKAEDDKPAQFAEEIRRFFKAISAAKRDLEILRSRIVKTYKKQEASDIISTYLMFIDDPSFFDSVTDKIRRGYSAYDAITEFFDEILEKFKRIDDKYLREREKDIKYVRRYILTKLFEAEINWDDILKRGDILIIPFISPVDVLYLSDKGFKGVIVERGSETSHTSILARALSLPMVKYPDATEVLEDGQELLIDGAEGIIIVEPEESDGVSERVEIKPIGEPRTSDGVYVDIFANIDFPEEAVTVKAYGAKGVGIFRTEYLYMTSKDWPSEEQQVDYIRRLLNYVGDLPVTIRIADLGGEKIPIYAEFLREVLNYRGIRFFMHEERLFRTHIRAILKAFSGRSLRLLIPMVSSPYEVKWVKTVMDEELGGISEKPEEILLGAMIETPAGVMSSAEICEDVDFVSVGTNDLMSFSFGIDRELKVPDYLEPPENLTLIRMLKEIYDAASGKEITVCGEVARDRLYLPYILAIGIRRLSINPAFIPDLVSELNRISVKDVKLEGLK